MAIQKKFGFTALFSLIFASAGCMNQARNAAETGISRNLFSGQTSGILNGQVQNAGGSGTLGALTPQDSQALQTVVQSPEVNPVLTQQDKQAGIDDAMSAALQKEAEELKAKAAQAEKEKNTTAMIQIYAAKMNLLTRVVTDCEAKAQKLAPLPGDPVVGKWVKASGDCEVAAFTVGTGTNAISGVSGGINGQLKAFPDGTIEIRSQSLNGKGRDSGYQGNAQAAGIATLTGTRTVNSKGGPQYVACTANVVLDQPQNQMPEKHDKAMALLGSCYQKGVAILGLQTIFSKMDPTLSNVLFQQMIR